MQILERTKKEIEAKTQTMSDFLKMEYLELCIKKFLDMEIHRYCYEELAKLYEKKHMYSEALKYITKFKSICIMQREKVTAFDILNNKPGNAEITTTFVRPENDYIVVEYNVND